jgi:hypothetical protein
MILNYFVEKASSQNIVQLILTKYLDILSVNSPPDLDLKWAGEEPEGKIQAVSVNN